MTRRRLEIDVPADTFHHVRRFARTTGHSNSDAAAILLSVAVQALASIAAGARDIDRAASVGDLAAVALATIPADHGTDPDAA